MLLHYRTSKRTGVSVGPIGGALVLVFVFPLIIGLVAGMAVLVLSAIAALGILAGGFYGACRMLLKIHERREWSKAQRAHREGTSTDADYVDARFRWEHRAELRREHAKELTAERMRAKGKPEPKYQTAEQIRARVISEQRSPEEKARAAKALTRIDASRVAATGPKSGPGPRDWNPTNDY